MTDGAAVAPPISVRAGNFFKLVGLFVKKNNKTKYKQMIEYVNQGVRRILTSGLFIV